jgi:hypothetical protein
MMEMINTLSTNLIHNDVYKIELQTALYSE